MATSRPVGVAVPPAGPRARQPDADPLPGGAAASARPLLRFLTCGSVDDGKSTLIGRLLHDAEAIHEDQLDAVRRDSARFGSTGPGAIDLALLTDGLKAEREQGITIDVAHRYFSTARRAFIIADTPGHEEYTRNMATGASTCQLAVVLVDARHGVQAQTRRHVFIASLLGIRHVVVAVNKMDLVGYAPEPFERIRRELAGFAARLDIPDVRYIPLSALRGDNVVAPSSVMPWYSGPPLLGLLETVQVAPDTSLVDLRLPVQLVVRAPAGFRGFAGTIASGTLRRTDEIVALPGGRRSRVASILTPDGERDEACAPMAVSVTLTDEIDIARGDMLVHPGGLPHVSTRIEAMVVWMAERPLVPGRRQWIKQTTRTVSAEPVELRHVVDVNTLEARRAAQLQMNEIGHVVLELDQPLVWDAYRVSQPTGSFIIIDRVTNHTVGAGMLLDSDDPASAEGPGLRNLTLDGLRSLVSPEERLRRLGQKGATVLLVEHQVGNVGARLAYALERALFDAGRLAAVIPPRGSEPGLRNPADRWGRAEEVARILAGSGLICIDVVDIDQHGTRGRARPGTSAAPELVVHLVASGSSPGTGLSSSVDEDGDARDVRLPADPRSVEANAGRILAALREHRIIPSTDGDAGRSDRERE